MSKKLCIVLVDDNVTDLFIHERFLTHTEIARKIISFNNAEDALHFLNEQEDHDQKPDLILLDIQMPVMNGFDFLHKYEQLQFTQKSHVVMVSSSLDFGDINRVKAHPNVLGLLEKPIDMEALVKLLKSYGVM